MIAEIDLTKFAEKSEVPSIDGYATETWVEDKNYLTDKELEKSVSLAIDKIAEEKGL